MVEVARIMESYLFRLKVCQLPTNGLNRMVIALCDKTKTAGDYRARLVSLLNASFPDNKKFTDSLMNVNLYSLRNNLAKLALVVLEESRTKETIDFDDAQVEHIMPQRLNNDWRIELPNANRITQELIAIFPKPVDTLQIESMTGEHVITESIDITGKKPTRLTINDEDIPLDSWRKMLISFMEYIWRLDSRNYEKIKGDSSLNKMLFASQRSPEILDNGTSIETNFSANVVLALISKIAEIFDIADEVSYTIK